MRHRTQRRLGSSPSARAASTTAPSTASSSHIAEASDERSAPCSAAPSCGRTRTTGVRARATTTTTTATCPDSGARGRTGTGTPSPGRSADNDQPVPAAISSRRTRPGCRSQQQRSEPRNHHRPQPSGARAST